MFDHHPEIKMKCNRLESIIQTDSNNAVYEGKEQKPTSSSINSGRLHDSSVEHAGEFVYGVDNPNFQLEFYSNSNKKRWSSTNSVANQNALIDMATSLAFNLVSKSEQTVTESSNTGFAMATPNSYRDSVF